MSEEWKEYQRQVLGELQNHSKQLQALTEEVVKARIGIATLKVKSGIWGAAAGALMAFPAGLYMLFKLLG